MWGRSHVAALAVVVFGAATSGAILPSPFPSTHSAADGGDTTPELEIDGDELEGVGADEGVDISEVPLREVPASQPGVLRAPQAGTGDNPFSNTCDGKTIGFIGPAGDIPRMQLSGAPAGARFECRTGPADAVGKQPFRPCDGGDGTKPVHTVPLTVEGTHRTDIRYTVNAQQSAVTSRSYYVHRSLDRVSCCTAPASDAALFAAARAVIPATEVFQDQRLDNPFIAIPRPDLPKRLGSTPFTKILSLRRTFRMSPDSRLLLIRRTMASRRVRERTGQNSCVGLRISEPTRSTAAAGAAPCGSAFPRHAKYAGGLVASKCPSIYCTVSTCRVGTDGCKRITHTFNRGPGQKPWIATKTVCPAPVITAFTPYECDAYVLNANGQGVCLGALGGRPVVRKAFADKAGLGLRILAPQRNAHVPDGKPPISDRYVFSAKSLHVDVKNTLFLPK